MTKLRRMDIILTNPQIVYFPGQMIQGQLQIDLSADMKMRESFSKVRSKIKQAEVECDVATAASDSSDDDIDGIRMSKRKKRPTVQTSSDEESDVETYKQPSALPKQPSVTMSQPLPSLPTPPSPLQLGIRSVMSHRGSSSPRPSQTGVRIKCRGKGHVRWSEGSGDNRRTYSASEDYIENILVVHGQGSNSGNETVLPEGSHVFPFQFVLPPSLPGSFEGKCDCYVRYFLKGTIDKPWKFDHEVKALFTVGSVLDLNTVQGATNAIQDTDSKTVCCCCCETPPINASLRLDKTGYVPGEPIICNAEINDGTGRGVASSKIKLLMKITYRTHGGSTTKEHKECARIEHGPISPGDSDVFSGEALVVPPLPPSFLPGCNIIDIEYKVKLAIDVLETPFDLDVTLDVIIGTIPLQATVQQYWPHTQFGVVTNQPPQIGAPVGFDLPPPTYQECVFGKVDTTDDDDKHATGNMNFAPSYTYYDWTSAPPAPMAPMGLN